MTSYNTIYEVFSNKITDYDMAQLDIADYEDILCVFLKSAIIKFKKCSNDLSSRDETLKQFNATLTEEEIEILAVLMIIEWMNPNINTLDYLQQNMSTKDFNIFSPANQLKEIKDLKKQARKEASQLISSYSWSKVIRKV